MAFILILSPRSAPPVFLFEGSTDISPMVLSGKSIKNLLTSSSTKEDLPAPPVPVIPSTGVFKALLFLYIFSRVSLATSGKFSAADMILAMAPGFLSLKRANSPLSLFPTGKSDVFTKSLIMPCRPRVRPSSGEYILVIPYAINSLISLGSITPPPPPNILI